MGFLTAVVEWFGQSTVMLQIYFDTGYMATAQQFMPVLTQEIHDRLERWIMADEDKK